MLNYILQSIPWDKDLPHRSKMIDLYTRVYDGTLYNHLKYFYFQERQEGQGGSYIKINQRQPSVKTRFCKLVTDNSVSLLFGSEHFPSLVCEDEVLRDDLENIIKEYKINKIMSRSATIGSTGSVIIFVRVFDGIFRFEPRNTKNIFPIFDDVIEDKLTGVVERYKVKGSALIEQGYKNVEYPNKHYWFKREWDENSEIYYLPSCCEDKEESYIVDKKRSKEHNFGFVPAIWIKNLPRITDSDEHGNIVDGACTFEPGIDTNIEIDYQLSQAGRALKYSSDPLLVLKLEDEMSLMQTNGIDSGDGTGGTVLPRSANNVLTLNEKDEAKLLEISGDACKAVREYVRDLREYMMEAIGGNKAHADKVNASQSGRAMQAMNQSLIWLTDHLRISYGECGLLKLINMIMDITNVPGYGIKLNGKLLSKLTSSESISLKWPPWYPDTPSDKMQNASALKTLSDAAIISKETSTKSIADNYGIEDHEEEQKRIDVDLQKIADAQPELKQIQNI